MSYSSQRPGAPLVLLLGALLIPAGYAQQTAPATPAPATAAPAAPAAAANSTLSSSLGLFVFPAKNQTPTQQSTDEGACFDWAKSQTGIDPMNIKPPAPAQPSQQQAAAQQEQQQQAYEQQGQAWVAQQKATYNKAFSACMEGKGYTVK